ncbi:MAG TPA: type I-U CRISPR-associated RAMP protein Csb1/Cas7u [Stellaceae bacterium]|nr:type I-U CRISPR-associated RAMP protein Csb1/Cas7u [Stellaceae bacterium]
MDYATLTHAVAQDAALRRKQVLQPVGGKNDKIFPPTYPEERRGHGPRHVFERRHIDAREVWCVLVDTVQSQANRLEEALLDALREKAIELPYVTVDFTDANLSGLSEITSLDAPHRVYDAILRDSLLDGQPFMKSPLGLRLAQAKPGDATALLEASPTALLFGAWHSTGEGGGLGAKFPRCLVSEIIAVDVPVEDGPTDPRTGEIEVRTAGRRTGSRIDPLGILRRVEVFKSPEGWDTVKERAGKNAKPVRPSEINHGNIAPTVQPLGITCDHAEHTAVLSFAGLRRLGFGGGERDIAGRTYLAALGILALTEQDARGYSLRSRCDLVCDGRAPLELVHADGAVDRLDIDGEAARRLYAASLAAAREAELHLYAEPIRLRPQDKLVEIVRRSQRLALEGEGGEADPQP